MASSNIPYNLIPPYVGRTFTPPTPIDLETIQSYIVERLKSRLPSAVTVEGFLDRGPKYRLTNQQAAVLVRYNASRYGDLRQMYVVSQERWIQWSVQMLVRSLGWNYSETGMLGAYQLIEQIQLALMGFQIPGMAQRMRCMSDVYRNFDEGVWWWEFIFEHVTMVIQEDDTPLLPPFKRGTMLEVGHITVRSSGGTYVFDSNDTVTLGKLNVSGVIVRSQDQSVTYAPTIDYTVDGANGRIFRVLTGAIPAGATVLVSFDYGEVTEAYDAASGGTASPYAPSNRGGGI